MYIDLRDVLKGKDTFAHTDGRARDDEMIKKS